MGDILPCMNRDSDPKAGDEQRGLYGQRPSRSHDVFRRKQFERIALLSPLERMIEALELSEDTAGPEPADREENASRGEA